MYNIFKIIENIIKIIREKIKILYWKLKYGKRIKIGKNLKFRKGFIINMTKEAELEIGDNNFFNNNCSINCRKKIVIGNNNIFGENVKMYDHNHVFNDKNINFRRNFKTNIIEIGSENWFGSNVTILKKSKIKDRNVVGANTVLNIELDSENLIKNENKLLIDKIKYKNN